MIAKVLRLAISIGSSELFEAISNMQARIGAEEPIRKKKRCLCPVFYLEEARFSKAAALGRSRRLSWTS